jgi:hypothetical protein
MRRRQHRSGTFAWVEKNGAASWNARDGAGLRRLNGKLWILGGWNTDLSPLTKNEVLSSDDDGATWTVDLAHTNDDTQTGPGARWIRRHCPGGWQNHSVGGTEYIYVLGGDHLAAEYSILEDSYGVHGDVWRSSDPANDDGWEQMCDNATAGWRGRTLHTTSSHNGYLYLMGGQTGVGAIGDPPYPYDNAHTPVFYNDVWRSPDGAVWTQIQSNAAWSARSAICNVPSWNGRMWLVGGGKYPTGEAEGGPAYIDSNDRTYGKEVWSSADGVTWTQHADFAGTARMYHSVEVYAGRLWVMGGYVQVSGVTGTNGNDVWSTNDGETWTHHADAPWQESHGDGTCVDENGIWHGTGNAGLTSPFEKAIHLLTLT